MTIYHNFPFYFYTRKDHEPPVLVKCPDDIVVKTDESFATVGWEEPIYTDNCGDVTKCLQVKSQYRNPIRIPVGLTYLIKYLAIDRNHNVNAECKFTIQVKGKYSKSKEIDITFMFSKLPKYFAIFCLLRS